MTKDPQDARKDELAEAQAVVLGEKFASLERRFDALERRMGQLERRIERLDDKMFRLILVVPALFVAQTAVLAAVLYVITRAPGGQG